MEGWQGICIDHSNLFTCMYREREVFSFTGMHMQHVPRQGSHWKMRILLHVFFPCVLAHAAKETPFHQLLLISSLVPNLMVTFKCSYCPKGLAGALIKYVMTNEMKWNQFLLGNFIMTKYSEIKSPLKLGPPPPNTHTHTCTHVHTHTHRRTCTHAHTHTHRHSMHVHTHTHIT